MAREVELTEKQFEEVMVRLDERFQRDKVYGDALREIHFLLASLERPPLAATRAMDIIERIGLDPQTTLEAPLRDAPSGPLRDPSQTTLEETQQ